MTQSQLQEYAVPGHAGDVLKELRKDSGRALWFPDEKQRVFVWHDRRSPGALENDVDVDPAPWVKSQGGDAARQRLSLEQLVDRLLYAQDDPELAPEYEYELVTPTWCSGCQQPIVDGHEVESVHDWLTDTFCSAYCLHEAEHELNADGLSPTVDHTDYATVHVRVSWPDDADRVDAHLHDEGDA